MGTEIPRVFDFQTSIETLRAHHWRAFADAYSGCAFNCQYCLYKGPDDYGRHVRTIDATAIADADLGILDIGTSTDPYQPIEATEKRTRTVLEAALEQRIPVFLLTRGTMVERDVDILSDLAREGLVEVCFSVITLNEALASRLEVRAPRPADRLRTAEHLAGQSIPVSFHVAPVIPGLNSPADMDELGFELAGISGRHVFAAVLGAQRAFWGSFYGVMDDAAADCHSIDEFRAAYGRDLDFERSAAVTCGLGPASPTLMPLREGVTRGGALFVSENFPHLTTGALEGGIYRWKLPTVYDMAAWVSTRPGTVYWNEFDHWYQEFRPGPELTTLVKSLWDSRELFVGAAVKSDGSDGPVGYRTTSVVTESARTTLVARRAARR
ncbi:SPL family radical SAM protein [Nocardia sp. NPDC020380]|uniref:SPL family radical SAM protein n=1 Tax=Nocardia sp. NPDC020380 TaxID=3364309 RepID=UPI003796C613